MLFIGIPLICSKTDVEMCTTSNQYIDCRPYEDSFNSVSLRSKCHEMGAVPSDSSSHSSPMTTTLLAESSTNDEVTWNMLTPHLCGKNALCW